MNDQTIKNMRAVRAEALGMIRNLAAIKGDTYSRVAHTAILIDSIDDALEMLVVASDNSPVSNMIAESASNMLVQMMKLMVVQAGLDEEQFAEALHDADRIIRNAHSLVETAQKLSDEGKDLES